MTGTTVALSTNGPRRRHAWQALASLLLLVLTPLALLTLLLAAGPARAQPCTVLTEVCAAGEGPQSRLVDGVPVFRECWRYESAQVCETGLEVSTCGPLAARGCEQLGSQCQWRDAQGVCRSTTYRMRCPIGAPGATTTTVCRPATHCESGACPAPATPDDRDFGAAITALEVQRQAGAYLDPQTLTVFKGYASSCRASPVNCCKPSAQGAQLTNHNVLSRFGTQAVTQAGQAVTRESLRLGSRWVHDTLVGEGRLLDSALQSVGLSVASPVGSSLAAGFVGPVTGYELAAQEAQVAINELAAAAGTNFSTFGAQFNFSFAEGFNFVGFDPYLFSLQLALALVQALMQCSGDELQMQLRLGADLCVFTGTSRSGFLRMIRNEHYCCFNSRLARTVNLGARRQLGQTDANGVPSVCAGLSLTELASIDLGQIDFSALYSEMQPLDLAEGAAAGRGSDTATRQLQNYFQSRQRTP